MCAIARRVVLPNFVLTETTQDPHRASATICLPDGTVYHLRQKHGEDGRRTDHKERWVNCEFDRFPIVLRANGEPWDEANVWLMMRIEGKPYPNMESFLGMAEDMAAFCQFLDEKSIDWLTFPKFKLHRPTYRYNKYLRDRINLGEITASTAKRRMSRVVNFYRYLISDGLIRLENDPWVAGEAYIPITDPTGEHSVLKVKTTDVGINIPKQEDPFDDTIIDGGRLRPLPQREQEWLFEALAASGHPEHMLIHLVALATGARIQTVLTMRVKHFLQPYTGSKTVTLPVGPGTSIDMKNNKKMALRIPGWLYTSLQTYAKSQRAQKRRLRSPIGDSPNQYLFLSPSGAPMYTSRDGDGFPNGSRRHSKRGQTVRTYIRKYILPYIRKRYSPTFDYQFHDLRATFGMNLVDACMKKINAGVYTYTQVLTMVAGRMGHARLSTTERYLQYRGRIALANVAQDNWEMSLLDLASKAMEQVNA